MTRKQWTLIAFAVLLAGFSLYLNKDWFAKDNIQIYHRSRPARGGRPHSRVDANSEIEPIVFGFDNKIKLTELKVVALRDLETNKYPHAIWHLVSDSNSVPVKDFSYGANIEGMHPAVSGVSPESLEPGTKYRLLVAAGPLKAGHDFVPVANSQ